MVLLNDRIKPVLVFAVGNPSRGDDALGPLLINRLERSFDLVNVELLTDFQWQIEHALDLNKRSLVLFVDAAEAIEQSFEFCELISAREFGYTSHALKPEVVMAVFQSLNGKPPPPCFLLAVKGHSFELGEGLSKQAANNMKLAAKFAGQLLTRLEIDEWRSAASGYQIV